MGSSSSKTPTKAAVSSIKQKQMFRRLFSYLVAKLTMEELQENGLVEIFQNAMEYYQRNLGQTVQNVHLETIDYNFLYYGLTGAKTAEEISNYTGYSEQAVWGKVKKLMELALIYTFKEKKITYIATTIWGQQIYNDYVARGKTLI